MLSLSVDTKKGFYRPGEKVISSVTLSAVPIDNLTSNACNSGRTSVVLDDRDTGASTTEQTHARQSTPKGVDILELSVEVGGVMRVDAAWRRTTTAALSSVMPATSPPSSPQTSTSQSTSTMQIAQTLFSVFSSAPSPQRSSDTVIFFGRNEFKPITVAPPAHSGRVRTFIVSFHLPEQLPPSFSGSAVKFLYYMNVTVKARVDVHDSEKIDLVSKRVSSLAFHALDHISWQSM